MTKQIIKGSTEIFNETKNKVNSEKKSYTISKKQILTLAAVFAISPFAIDTYLPAMPIMATSMNVEISMISVTLSLYLLGLGLGQLIGGPLSDKKGRAKVMTFGLIIFSVSSFLLTTSSSIEWLWLWRFIQAIGGGIALVGVPAIIRDNTSGKESAKLFSLISLIMMIAPSIAPSVGAFILLISSWEWIFYFLALMAVIVTIFVNLFIPVKPPVTKGNFDLADVQSKNRGLLSVFKEKQALGFMIAQGFGYAVMMCFLANASMIYMQNFKVTPKLFSILFFVNVATMIVVNRLNTYLLGKYEPEKLLKLFLSMQLFGACFLVILSIIAPTMLYLTVIGFAIAVGANGGIMANASASFLKFYSYNAGAASAVLGASQQAIGATISAFAAMISFGDPQIVMIIMFISSFIALTAAIKADKRALPII